MYKKINYILILTLFINFVNGQGGFKRSITLPNAKLQVSHGIVETTPNNYMHVGLVIDTINGNQISRLCVVGLNQFGQIQWVKKYGNNKNVFTDHPLKSEYLKRIDNSYLFSTTILDSTNSQIGCLIKLNSIGDTLWLKKYYSSTYPINIINVTKSFNGGYLLISTLSNSLTGAYYLVIKTDIVGNELWRKEIHKSNLNGPDHQYASAILQDSVTKKIIIVGSQTIGNSSSWSWHSNIVITDSLGNFLTRLNYPNNLPGDLKNIMQCKDGKFIAVGNTNNNEVYNSYTLNYGFIVKFDVNATTPIWQKTFYDEKSILNYYNNVIEKPNGDLIISGTEDTAHHKGKAINLLGKITWLDKDGNRLRKQFYQYTPTNTLNFLYYHYSFNKTNDNNFISCYFVDGIPPRKFFIVKYDSLGCDSSSAYCTSVGFKELKYEVTDVKIYPQPANETLNLESQLFGDKLLLLKVSNQLGQNLITQTKQSKNGIVQISLASLPKGIYILQLTDKDGKTFSQKIIKE
ncbi:MAG: T9SS type A sorting domain-containing protein [Bacteroidetes bacterium]|nr:T9SS type A sorting domain-containing protein [Bacteroidota bacterium]MCA6444930.1 T9SS type A sorting domain-containing protein [Bacteroidota bacterium]